MATKMLRHTIACLHVSTFDINGADDRLRCDITLSMDTDIGLQALILQQMTLMLPSTVRRSDIAGHTR